jgi:hypothetical protein
VIIEVDKKGCMYGTHSLLQVGEPGERGGEGHGGGEHRDDGGEMPGDRLLG